jgi:type I protein arginine methyltransferase
MVSIDVCGTMRDDVTGDLDFHAFCLTDTGTRLDQYARAIAHAVRPGDVVVDIGAGSGILSFLACAAGAQRVYAIEAGDAIAYGRLLAATSGFADRICFLHSSSLRASLSDRVDLVVGDIHDTFGLQSTGLGALVDARDRFLKPGGIIMPMRIRLLAAPVEAPDLYQKAVDVWQRHVQHVDLSPLRMLAVNERHPGRFRPSQLLAPPTQIAEITLATVADLHVGGTATITASRAGTMHGVCGCFVTTLADGIEIGNVPGASATTNFAQAFFPVATPQRIDEGDSISIHIDTFDGAQTRWQITITPRSGAETTRFDHSTFHSATLSGEDLRKQAADYRPQLTSRGVMEQELLGRFDGATSSAELERWLLDRFGDQLPSPREAAAILKSTIDRCG